LASLLEPSSEKNRNLQMAKPPEADLLEPLRASMLLELEGGTDGQKPSLVESEKTTENGIRVRGLDTKFRSLWKGGRAIGIGTVLHDQNGSDQDEVSSLLLFSGTVSLETWLSYRSHIQLQALCLACCHLTLAAICRHRYHSI